MKRFVILFCVAALAACGQGGQRQAGSSASGEACALIPEPDAIFGQNAQQVSYGRLDAIAASCEFQSADGARSGEVTLSTPASLGSVTAEASMADTVEKWGEATEAPLGTLEGLGDDARIATDLPGYQTQIVFRQGGKVVMVMGGSGDDAMSGEQIARGLAQSASHALSAAPAQ
jgi:hypothetical protein